MPELFGEAKLVEGYIIKTLNEISINTPVPLKKTLINIILSKRNSLGI